MDEDNKETCTFSNGDRTCTLTFDQNKSSGSKSVVLRANRVLDAPETVYAWAVYNPHMTCCCWNGVCDGTVAYTSLKAKGLFFSPVFIMITAIGCEIAFFFRYIASHAFV